jgi:ankyrin repeat protein
MLLNDNNSKRAKINRRNDKGSTLIIFFMPLGYMEAVCIFLEKGADINALNKYKNALLYWAIAYILIIRLLLEKGVYINAKNDKSRAVLY